MKVLGVQALLARFARAAVLGEMAGEAGALATAYEITEAAKAQAPVETGELRDSIVIEGTDVHVTAPYAGFVEFGTINVPAQPYLRPAADAAGETVESAARRVLGPI